MIEVNKDSDGKIISYIVWQLVDEKGHFKKDGKYVWVDDLWTHPDYRKNGTIRKYINKICKIAPQAEYCYFNREKYDRVRIYRRFNIYTKKRRK